MLGALRDRGEEHLGRARMAVLLQEVVLDLPDRVHADRVRVRALLEGVLEERVLRVLVPGPRELMLVEEPESHARVVGAARGPTQDAATEGVTFASHLWGFSASLAETSTLRQRVNGADRAPGNCDTTPPRV